MCLLARCDFDLTAPACEAAEKNLSHSLGPYPHVIVGNISLPFVATKGHPHAIITAGGKFQKLVYGSLQFGF